MIINSNVIKYNETENSIYPKAFIDFNKNDKGGILEDNLALSDFRLFSSPGYNLYDGEYYDDMYIIEPLVEGWGTTYFKLYGVAPNGQTYVIQYSDTNDSDTTTPNVNNLRWSTFLGSENTFGNIYLNTDDITNFDDFILPFNDSEVKSLKYAQLSDGRVVTVVQTFSQVMAD